MNVGNTIKPTDLKTWDIVKHEPGKHSPATRAMKNPDWYWYYEKDGLYYPHRKPTTKEMCNNQFY